LRGDDSEAGEAVEIGAEHVALEDEIGEFALALDTNEAGVFEFLHVVGEGRGTDGLTFAEAGAGSGALIAADLGEDLITAGRGEGAGDEGELAVGYSGLLRWAVDPLRWAVDPLHWGVDPLHWGVDPLHWGGGPLRGSFDPLRGAGRVLSAISSYLTPEAAVFRANLIRRRLTYIALLHTVSICRALSASPSSVVAACCAGFGWSMVRV
jgi:hypothetical protein